MIFGTRIPKSFAHTGRFGGLSGCKAVHVDFAHEPAALSLVAIFEATGLSSGSAAQGRFYASRECDKDSEAKVLEFVANPAEAARVYGQTTGTCCVCNATLRSEWKYKGIGPVCAEKFG
jgi:hypothetical protein